MEKNNANPNAQVSLIVGELQALSREDKRESLPRFFKTGKGQYGEGDRFLGVVVPDIRAVAKRHKQVSWTALDDLLASPWHEVRMCALLIMVEQWKRAGDAWRQQAFDFYLAHAERANNWDLVDLSAPTIVGKFLLDKPSQRGILDRLAAEPSLWKNRIAMVATQGLIRSGELDDTYRLAGTLLNHPHDLMHKAVGWMLREAGKRDEPRLVAWLREHKRQMPRTALRYSIERLNPALRRELMA